jgi:catalase
VHHYQRDGAMAGMCPLRGDSNVQGAGVNFYPNDRVNDGAAVPEPSVAEPPMPTLGAAWVTRFPPAQDEDHYSQAGNLFRLMDEAQKDQLAQTIAGGLVYASESAQQRMLEQFDRADPDYAARIACSMNRLAQSA